jgi:hypothetical protein
MRLCAVLLGMCVLAAVSLAVGQSAPATAPASIDWAKAKELRIKERAGTALTAEEKDYLQRAKAELAAGKGPTTATANALPPGQQRKLDRSAATASGPASTQAAAKRAGPAPVPPQRDRLGVAPLCDMTAEQKYKGEDGGLYGAGQNTPPKAHMAAAAAALARIKPLDAAGKPASDGKIVLLSIGMSNTTQEFAVFKKLADADSEKNPQVVIVDGAQGGADAKAWLAADAKAWNVVDKRLGESGVSAAQVQAAWIKQAQHTPSEHGEFPKHAQELCDDLLACVLQAKARYPNLQVVYLSSRIYAGYAKVALNPEPYAYESAFAVRWAIQRQMGGAKEVNCDASKGDVKAPVLLWGPYLWADGLAGRKIDNLVWTPADYDVDCTHPALSARKTVAALLLEFLKKDPAAGTWFTKAVAAGQ